MNTLNLFKFLESCPLKLFESVFADFLKDKSVPFDVIESLLNSNSIGSFYIIYYIISYSAEYSKKQKKIIIEKLHQYLLINYQQNLKQNIYILNILTSEQIIDFVDFEMDAFLVGDVHHSDVEEQRDKISTSIIIKKIQNQD